MSTATLIEPQDQILSAVRQVTAIATLPEITARIIETVNNPNSSAAQLHKIVAHDPALVTRILKVVNSAFYGLPGQIGSIERAIVLLGLNAVKNIAVAASLGQMFKGVQLCKGFTARDLWRHCIAVAVAARDMARQMKLPIADEAFLAGMVHDIGLLVSLQVHPEKLQQVCEHIHTNGGDFCDIERQVIGTDHQQLGAVLAEQWKFPNSVRLVARYHHKPTTLADENRMLVTLVYLADTIACQAGQGFNLTALLQSVEEAGLDANLEIAPAVIERTSTSLEQLVADAASLLG
jgi:putative nucleotidyltransferase with HDIG domain